MSTTQHTAYCILHTTFTIRHCNNYKQNIYIKIVKMRRKKKVEIKIEKTMDEMS